MIKKILSLILICTLVLGMSACKKEDSATNKSESSPKNQTEKATSASSVSQASIAEDAAPPLPSSAPKSQKGIESYVKTLITSEFDKMNIDTLTVLQDRSATEPDSYKIHTIISWSGELSPSDSRTTLEAYSTTISEMINANCNNVSELSLVWLASNITGRGNVKYIKADGFLSLSDISFDSKFGVPPETSGEAISNTPVDPGSTDMQ